MASNQLSVYEIKVFAQYALAFLIFFYTFYGLSSILVDDDSRRYQVAFNWETRIPFIPHAAWIYNSLVPLLIISLYYIRQQTRIHLLFKIFCAQVLIGCTIFLIVPIEIKFPSRYEYGELPLIFIIADSVNLTNNNFPSLHVCLAVTASVISSFYMRIAQRLIIYLWAIAIALSTLLIHEHHFVDVIGGVFLSGIGILYYVRKISQQPDV